MQKVMSKDGTPIAVYRSGEGIPLVLVHGGASLGMRWIPILPSFEKNFTVYVVDRRGRGGSGDSNAYAIEREFEDIAAVVDSIGKPVNLLGHSFGALCSLEAARLTRNVRTLIVYEPALFDERVRAGMNELIVELQAQLDAGKREEVYVTFASRVAGMTARDLEMQRAEPELWNARLAIVHTLVRELRAAHSYQFVPDRFRDLAMPVRCLFGDRSSQWLKTATEQVHAAIRYSTIVGLPGQGHTAMDTAPDMFVREVTNFAIARM